MSATSTTVLFAIFNRPALTRRSFERIRAARPRRLYVVADGPRAARPDDGDLCQAARDAVRVDWPCEVVRDFAAVNLGCKRRISSGITAALGTEERLIVLEDDCIADPTFFRFCDELLERYADDPRVLAISGDHFQRDRRPRAHSYYFSRYPHCWGWATWRRAWRHFDPAMSEWPRLAREGWLERLFETPGARAHWRGVFDAVYDGEIDSWAYAWTFAAWRHGGLTALPEVNLVTNVGFGSDATHTRSAPGGVVSAASGGLRFPLRHPPDVVRDAAADAFTQATHFEARPASVGERLRARAGRLLVGAARRIRARLIGDADGTRRDLARLAPLRDAARCVPGTARFRGVELAYLDGPSLYWQLQEVFVDGCYDVDLETPAPRILDLGGNLGMAALRFRELASGARLTVLEADSALAETLARNLRAAGDTATEVIAKAAWTHDGVVKFSGRGDDAGRVADDGALEVPCVDVAALCREPIDLLKIDVEGAERELIERLATSGGLSNVRRIVLEWHDRGDADAPLHELLARLAAVGFEYRIRRAVDHAALGRAPSGSGFRAVKTRGGVCLVYAWRPR